MQQQPSEVGIGGYVALVGGRHKEVEGAVGLLLVAEGPPEVVPRGGIAVGDPLFKQPAGAQRVAFHHIAEAGLQGACHAKPRVLVALRGTAFQSLERPYGSRIGRLAADAAHTRRNDHYQRQDSVFHLGDSVTSGTSISCIEMPPCWKVPR